MATSRDRLVWSPEVICLYFAERVSQMCQHIYLLTYTQTVFSERTPRGQCAGEGGALLPGPWSLQCCLRPDRLCPEFVLWEPDPCLSHLPVGTDGQHVSKLRVTCRAAARCAGSAVFKILGSLN